ncbi:hypothetical protein QJS10_CPA01g01572 [Acorus calamus]|uniref:Uncharacterized protein n=1 Tax=Acorus calamus TaxID=4465 RepID=A0AAV9FTN7_ACOCL|nr:hypothetical protein QJS10_CPA01g01572 [Acorus calamus]
MPGAFGIEVIKSDAQPGDICTRREYARWLVSASGALSRNTISKVYPAMYIEKVTELAFDDITPEDPDFASIQEAGLIQSKLSGYDANGSLDGELGSIRFFPESPLSRQDLVSWKMALEKSLLAEVDKKDLGKGRSATSSRAGERIRGSQGTVERCGIKVVVDSDLRDDANIGTPWLNAGKPSLVDGAVNRAENLVTELRTMAAETKGRSLAVIETVIQHINLFISALKQRASNAATRATGRARELQSVVVLKANESAKEFR